MFCGVGILPATGSTKVGCSHQRIDLLRVQKSVVFTSPRVRGGDSAIQNGRASRRWCGKCCNAPKNLHYRRGQSWR